MRIFVNYGHKRTEFANLADAIGEFEDLIAVEADSSVPQEDGLISVSVLDDGEDEDSDGAICWNVNTWATVCHIEGCDCEAEVHPGDDGYGHGNKVLVITVERVDDFDSYVTADERRDEIESIAEQLKFASDDVFNAVKRLLGV